MTREEKLFTAYNYVKGVQNFMKEAGIISYPAVKTAEEGMPMPEDVDATSLANAMAEQDVAIPGEGEDAKVLEIANAIIGLAHAEHEPVQEMEGEIAHTAEGLEGAKKEAALIREKLFKRATDETNNKPDQVLEISKTDYNKGVGNTTLPTEKGEVGKQENVEKKVDGTVSPNVTDKEHFEEGRDIFGKDYNDGRGNTTLKTEKGEVGAQMDVEHKIASKLARLGIEATLARLAK